VNKLLELVKHNSPHILTALAVGGVVGTAVLAVKATPNALADIREAQDTVPYTLKKREVVKTAWKHYIPAALCGATTIACIVGANTISTKREAALVAGAAFTERAYKEFRESAREELGEKKEAELHAAAYEKAMRENPPTPELIPADGDKILCMDAWSQRYFQANRNMIDKAVNDVNFQVINSGYASVNDFWRFLGLAPTSHGEEFGWSTTNKMDIWYTSILTSEDSKPVLVFDHYNGPSADYRDPWGK